MGSPLKEENKVARERAVAAKPFVEALQALPKLRDAARMVSRCFHVVFFMLYLFVGVHLGSGCCHGGLKRPTCLLRSG